MCIIYALIVPNSYLLSGGDRRIQLRFRPRFSRLRHLDKMNKRLKDKDLSLVKLIYFKFLNCQIKRRFVNILKENLD
jgi:hypothetical protein